MLAKILYGPQWSSGWTENIKRPIPKYSCLKNSYLTKDSLVGLYIQQFRGKCQILSFNLIAWITVRMVGITYYEDFIEYNTEIISFCKLEPDNTHFQG